MGETASKLKRVSNPPPKRTWRWVSSFKPPPETLQPPDLGLTRSAGHEPGKCSRRSSRAVLRRATGRSALWRRGRNEWHEDSGVQVWRQFPAGSRAHVARSEASARSGRSIESGCSRVRNERRDGPSLVH